MRWKWHWGSLEGRLTEATGGGNNTHDLRLNFVPRMDPHKLIEGYKRVLAEIYDPNRYFERCIKLLRTMKHASPAPRRRRSGGRPRWRTRASSSTRCRRSWRGAPSTFARRSRSSVDPLRRRIRERTRQGPQEGHACVVPTRRLSS